MASTLALRAASACIRPTTQAAPAISPFISSMPAARLDRNAARIEGDALADEGDRLGLALVGALAAAPAHDDDAALRAEPCPTPSSAHMPSACHGGLVENFDLDAELFQLLGPIGEFVRVKHIGWFVDERTRGQDALRHGLAPLRLAAGRRRVRRRRG